MHLVSVLAGQVLGRYRGIPGPLVGEVRKSVGGIVQRMAAYFPFGGAASGAERVRLFYPCHTGGSLTGFR